MEMDVGHRRGRHLLETKKVQIHQIKFRMQEQGDSRCFESQYTDHLTCQSPAISGDRGTSYKRG